MSRPTRKRCGRTLKDPVSIARGLGPVCAGSGGSSNRRRVPLTLSRSGRRYEAVAHGSGQLSLFAQGNEPDEPSRMSKRARIAKARECCFSVIGEAAARLSKDLRVEQAHIDWRDIVGFRNFAVHQYFAVNWEIVWITATRDAPLLKDLVGKILAESFPEESASDR